MYLPVSSIAITLFLSLKTSDCFLGVWDGLRIINNQSVSLGLNAALPCLFDEGAREKKRKQED